MGRAAWLAFAICAAGVLTACSGGSGTQPSATGGDSSTKAGKAPLCAQGTMLPFDYKKAASVKDADGRPIGPDGAKSLVGELGDSDSVCGLDVSPDTQKVIDDAHALVQQGKKTDALSLIDAETTRVIALPSVGSLRYGTRGMAMAATGEADQKVRDLLGLGGAAQDAGDDGARQLAEAQAIYGPILEERLKSADWQEAVKIAAEAEKLGLDDLQKRAQDKVKSEVGKMADDARKNFDVCLSTDAQMKKRVTLLALAQMTLDDGAAAIGTITGVLNDTAAANVCCIRTTCPRNVPAGISSSPIFSNSIRAMAAAMAGRFQRPGAGPSRSGRQERSMAQEWACGQTRILFALSAMPFRTSLHPAA